MTADGAVTVRGLLDVDLTADCREEHLNELFEPLAAEPLDATVASLREALTQPIGMEDYRRLHILISHLVNQCGADIPLNRQLRAEVNTAFARRGETVRPALEGR